MFGKIGNIKAKIESLKGELASVILTESLENGKVTVVGNAARQITSIKIDPSLCTPENKELMEKSIIIAINRLMEKGDAIAKEKISEITGGMMPGLSSLFS